VSRGQSSVTTVKADAVAADLDRRSVTLADGTISGDYLVLAAGAQPNFFRTKGASEFAFPLYSLTDARHVRERVLQLYADANAKPELVDDGALTPSRFPRPRAPAQRRRAAPQGRVRSGYRNAGRTAYAAIRPAVRS
jgi:hypothetical protein